MTSQIGRDGVRSACCGPSRQWRQAGGRTWLRGRQLGGVQKRRAAPCAATATQGAAHRLLLGGRGASGRRRTSAKEGPTDPLLFFSVLVPSCSARPRGCDRDDEAAQRSSSRPPEPEWDVGSTAAAILSPSLQACPPSCRRLRRKGRGKPTRRADVAQGRQGSGRLARRRWPCRLLIDEQQGGRLQAGQ